MMKKNLLYVLFALLLSVGLAACGSSETDGGGEAADGGDDGAAAEGAADGYPERDIEILVGHGAGGGTDNFARQVAKQMEEILGVNINVINQEGASGAIAKEMGAKAPADGYTIVATSALPIQVATGINTNNELNVYNALARFQSDTYALQAKAGTFESIEDFVAQAEANPGTIRIGGTGVGTMDQVVFTLLERETGLDLEFVPFEGAGQMHAAVLGGHIEAMLEEIGPTISSVEGGEIQPLIFFAEERIEDFPEIPTSVENGWDITNGVERGFLIRNEVPQEIIDKLEQVAKEVYDSEEYQQYEENSYLHLREGWLGSADYTEKLRNDIEVFTEILEGVEVE